MPDSTQHLQHTEAVIYRAENIHRFCPGECCGRHKQCRLSYFGQTVIIRNDHCRRFKSPERSAMDRRRAQHQRDAKPKMGGDTRPFYQALGNHPDRAHKEVWNEFVWSPVMRVMTPPPDNDGNCMDVKWPATIAEALFIYHFRTLSRSHGYNHDWPPGRRRTIDPRQPHVTAQLAKNGGCHFHLLVAIPSGVRECLAQDLGPGFAYFPQ